MTKKTKNVNRKPERKMKIKGTKIFFSGNEIENRLNTNKKQNTKMDHIEKKTKRKTDSSQQECCPKLINPKTHFNIFSPKPI
jgi:hypothetical protein